MPEQGDAGDLPASAQDLGDGAVSVIHGGFSNGGDADMYRLCLTDGRSFSASTVGGSERDTQLFLFNSAGRGVYANDDAFRRGRTSLLPAYHRRSPVAPGEYFLAISSFNREPQSSLGPIFPDTDDAIVVGATGPGASEPVIDWAGLNRGPAGDYRIDLTGTQVCVPPDTTPPAVDLRSPEDGVHVGQGTEVIVDFDCSDEGGSGLESCVGSVTDGALLDTSSLGEASVTVTARDLAGNETIVTNTVTVVDETPPGITVAAPEDGAVYDLDEHVAADYTCADEPNGSGMATCVGSVAPGSAVDTARLGSHTFTVNATDSAGNSSSTTVSYTVADRVAPGISITRPADGAVYALGEDVAADYACQDEANGSGVATCSGSVPPGAAVDTATLGAHTFTVNATDNAGNSSSTSVSYTVVDRGAPTISLTQPADGAVYRLGERVLAEYACHDEAGGSGVASCDGTVSVGAPLDTSRVGPRTFEVRAADHAGNSTSRTVTYTVGYDFDGFLAPLKNLPHVNRWKAGHVVPVRFRLGAYRGPVPVAAGYPKVAAVACGTGAQPAGDDRARGSWRKGHARRSKRGRSTYMFLWKTERKWAGSCRQLVLKLDDDALYRVEMQFVRRGHDRDWDDDWDDD